MFAHQSITRKLMTGMLMTSSAVLVLCCGTFLTYELVTFRQAMVRSLSTLAGVIATNSTAALAFANRDDAADVLSALAAEPDIVAAALYGKDETLFASYPRLDEPAIVSGHPDHDGYEFSRSQLVFRAPVMVGNRRLGTLYLQSNLGAMYGRLRLYGVMVVGVVVLSGLVAFVLSARLQRHISRPVMALAGTAQAVSEARDYSVRAERFDDDELGRLTDAFNAMLEHVQEQDRVLREQGNHLRREVAERGRAEDAVRAVNADLERRVSERTEALEVANNELESFWYSVSHDLRAPLRHVLGFVAMLEETTAGQLAEEPQRYLRTIREASTEMGQLIDDLLAFSRMGRSDLAESHVQLDALVQDAIRGAEGAAPGREILWQAAPLPQVLGDAAMLKQVFANLLDNAVKYTRLRRPAHIEIGCAGEEMGRSILFVRDNGAGFDMKYAGKLFGVFQRLHRADEFEGTGIGLATVRRIIARHGGRTWAEALPEHGATFFVTLKPIRVSEKGILMVPLKRILLVEDSVRDAEMALHALGEYHLANDVLHLRDGVEALDYLHRRGDFAGRTSSQPVLVLLDLKMPRVDGLEVLRQMKDDADLKTIPVVVMTSSREQGDLLRSYELGVNAYVVKPVRFQEFVEAVKQLGSFWAVINEPPPASQQAD